MKQNHQIFHTLFSVTGLLLVGKLLAFVKQLIASAVFGTTLETDILSLSQGFIGNIQYLFVQSLLTALIPVYIHTREQGEDTSHRFAFDVFKAFTLITAVICAVTVFCAPWIARLLAPRYDAEASAEVGYWLRICAPVLLLFMWTAIFNALLHANKRFIPGEIININQSLWTIVLILLLKDRFGLFSMAVAFWVYPLWNSAYTMVVSRQYWRISRGNPFRNPAVRRLLHMMGPLLLGYSLVYVNQLVDKMLVSGLAAGSVTALNYAAVLSDLVGTFITSFASIFFPYVTERISQKDDRRAAELTSQTAVILLPVFLPVSVLTALCAKDIVAVVYGRGAFGEESIRVCAQALFGYALMFPPLVLREVYSRYLYGYQDSRRPMVNSSIGILFNIVLSIALCPLFGVLGVTVATSVSVLICGCLNLVTAHKNHPALCGSGVVSALPWLAVGCAACGGAAYGVRLLLSGQGSFLRFAAAAAAGFAAYAVAASPLLFRLLREIRHR